MSWRKFGTEAPYNRILQEQDSIVRNIEISARQRRAWEYKNAFSYLLWAFYTVMVGTLMVGIGNIFCNDDLPSWCGIVFAMVLMAVPGGGAFLLHRLAPKLKAFFENREKLSLAAEAGILAVLFVLGAAFRAAGFQSVEDTAGYYELAEVTMGQEMPQIAHGAVHVYVQILHLVFLLLGNHYVFGITVQIVFQCVAVLLLYCQLRKYIGLIAAMTAAAFFTCAPYMVQAGLTLSPDMMYLCLLSAAGVVAASACSHGFGDGMAGGKLRLFFFVLAGIVSSVTAYLDVMGVVLMFFSVCMIFRVDRELSGPGRKAVPCLCCVLGFVFGFAGCALVDALVSGQSFGSALQVWFQLYRPGNFLMPATYGMQDSRVESLVLLQLMALAIYSFWFEKKRDQLTVYMLAACAVILAGCLGMFTQEMPGTLFLYLLFVIMAGIGLQQCFDGGVALKTQIAQEGGQEVWEREIQEREEQERQRQYKNEYDALADKEPPEKKEIKYLENPLPLPKKHEKKVLGYDYPVAEDDDFDI